MAKKIAPKKMSQSIKMPSNKVTGMVKVNQPFVK
jgi:hypothetical protein